MISDITDTLGQDNSDTEEYSWDESAADDSADSANNLQSSAVPIVSASTPSDNVCDICWLNPRAKIVFVPCGHARFCDSCARQMFASTKKCGICRQQINKLTYYCLFLIRPVICSKRLYTIEWQSACLWRSHFGPHPHIGSSRTHAQWTAQVWRAPDETIIRCASASMREN